VGVHRRAVGRRPGRGAEHAQDHLDVLGLEVGAHAAAGLRAPQRLSDGGEEAAALLVAERGGAETLRDDVVQLAKRHGWQVRRIVFEQPEDLSPVIADLYRWWYARQGVESDRLLVESFILLEPWWALTNRLVPFWMVFNTEPSFDAVNRYLDTAPPQSEIYLTLFSHGVNSVGLVPIERWRSIFDRARRTGGFMGVDEDAFPRDFAVFVRFHRALEQLEPHYSLPASLALNELDEFLSRGGQRYHVDWRGA
jgi:hypothetical protein